MMRLAKLKEIGTVWTYSTVCIHLFFNHLEFDHSISFSPSSKKVLRQKSTTKNLISKSLYVFYVTFFSPFYPLPPPPPSCFFDDCHNQHSEEDDDTSAIPYKIYRTILHKFLLAQMTYKTWPDIYNEYVHECCYNLNNVFWSWAKVQVYKCLEQNTTSIPANA